MKNEKSGNKSNTPIDTTVTINTLTFKNPVLLASGTCGYGKELSDLIDLNELGGLVVKGISLHPRKGNPPPRIAETPCGLLNAIGLENVGVKKFTQEKLPWLRQLDTKVLVNILGNSTEEYEELARILSDHEGIDGLEINISCPNVKKGGVLFGTDPAMAAQVTRAVVKASKLPVIVKLTPNVTDIKEIARAVEQEGASGISVINTLLAMAIDIRKKRPALANIFGGLSGPAIKPVALRVVWETARTVNIPVIGMGGISTYEDGIEFLMAGASAIQVGTATLVDPLSSLRIVKGISQFMLLNGYKTLKELRID